MLLLSVLALFIAVIVFCCNFFFLVFYCLWLLTVARRAGTAPHPKPRQPRQNYHNLKKSKLNAQLQEERRRQLIEQEKMRKRQRKLCQFGVLEGKQCTNKAIPSTTFCYARKCTLCRL